MTGDDEERPAFVTLLDWLEGRLTPAQSQQVAEQVAAGDSEIRDTVAWLRQFLDVARAVPPHQPPPIVQQHLQQYFACWQQAREALNRPPREFVVRLLFDSAQDQVPVGVRGSVAFASETVHLVYTGEVADLVLDVRRTVRGRVRLDGQVLLPAGGGAPVFEAEALGADFTMRTVDGDSLGRFTLTDVPDSVSQLRVGNGEIVLVADLDLGDGS